MSKVTRFVGCRCCSEDGIRFQSSGSHLSPGSPGIVKLAPHLELQYGRQRPRLFPAYPNSIDKQSFEN